MIPRRIQTIQRTEVPCLEVLLLGPCSELADVSLPSQEVLRVLDLPSGASELHEEPGEGPKPGQQNFWFGHYSIIKGVFPEAGEGFKVSYMRRLLSNSSLLPPASCPQAVKILFSSSPPVSRALCSESLGIRVFFQRIDRWLLY